MSKPHYKWWGYAKSMIRDYPTLSREYDDLHSQSITQSYSGMPRGPSDGRGLERIAIRELPSTKQREYESVKMAIRDTQTCANGADRLRLIDLVYWRQTHTLKGAVKRIPCGVATGKRWNGDFIRLVAAYYGLMDGDTNDG